MKRRWGKRPDESGWELYVYAITFGDVDVYLLEHGSPSVYVKYVLRYGEGHNDWAHLHDKEAKNIKREDLVRIRAYFALMGVGQ